MPLGYIFIVTEI